ncbi:MAG TPA: GNAT family N-acetyltransferase [Candidatus Dormibacteraeota bacterium]|nr:GNAT family N-acetyltransferase [Candidatus Dormibacteraeota bacterium]
MAVEIALARRMAGIDRGEWDALVGPDGSPFLEWDWLDALEQSGCVGGKTGWVPHHLTVRSDGRLIAAAPMYLKGHSQGEFVFDHTWAEAAERAGIDYYPKLLVGVPLTPATGRRLLTRPDQPRAALLTVVAEALRDLCLGNTLSSVHVNFCAEDEIAPLQAAGFLHRQGVQYHWRNHDYDTFDDYLGRMRSKRRVEVRRELRLVADQGITVTPLTGEAIADELFEPMFRLYKTTIDKLYWGRQYLNAAFFDQLRRRWKRNLCFVAAQRGDALLAGAINVQKNGVLYGRYWGCFEEVRQLHFVVCYYAGIRHCIERGLQRFEPGAGGEYKHWRGFDAAVTHSLHFVAHEGLARAVGDFLARERAHIDDVVGFLDERSVIKK